MTSYQFDIAARDIKSGISNWEMWGRLGWSEVKRRYRRTTLGPFWAVLSLGIFVVCVGTLWSFVWKHEIKHYLLWLSSGILPWVLTTTVIMESCTTFTSAEGIIKQMSLPYTTLTCSIVWRNVLVFLHNFIIYVLVAAFSGFVPNVNTLLVLPGLLFNIVTGVWISLLLGMLCARYRDVQQLVSSIIQIAFFLTPVFYSPDQLGPHVQKYLMFNFLHVFVDIVREPLLGKVPDASIWIMATVFTAVGWILTFVVFARFRRRITYWL